MLLLILLLNITTGQVNARHIPYSCHHGIPSSIANEIHGLGMTECVSSNRKRSMNMLLLLRAGATTDDKDSDDEGEDLLTEDDEEEEPVKAVTKSPSKATLQKALKSKTKEELLTKAALKASIKATKNELQSSLHKTKEKKVSTITNKRTSSTSILKKIPYIVRATLNPWIFFTMTRFYFASLFNINFLQEQPILRSAMQEQVRKSGGTSPGKKSRKMRPGQAKTLSDLPQLSS